MRCEDDNGGVFSAIFYKAPIQFSAGSVSIQTQQGTSWFRYLRHLKKKELSEFDFIYFDWPI